MIVRFTPDQLNKKFDLIIIGGGINGCGIARDAAERGLKVLLVEKEDFASGCTSASTRLIHGGLRYLEHFEFDLVRESLRERELLLKNANHLVKPLELCLPIYKGNKRGFWLIKFGMILYDLLSYDKSLPSHKILSAAAFKKYEPGINDQDLISAAVYYDSQIAFPERFCIENILMAKKCGALVVNHSEVAEINLKNKKIKSVEVIDKLTGSRHSFSGKIIINASGPWVDSLCKLTKKRIGRKIGGTKGSHIIIKKFDNGPRHAIYSVSKSDNRPFFIIPWREYYLIGTTDIPFSGDPDRVSIDKSEIDYLINETNSILKLKKITKNEILFSYSGIRPLPYMINTAPGDITRKHIIFDHESDEIENFISVIGGKLTTYRNLSELVVDLVCKKLNKEKFPTKTKLVSLVGCIKGNVKDFKSENSKKLSDKYKLDEDMINHLIDLYGNQVFNVLNLISENPDLGRLLSSHSLDIRAQVLYSLKNEMAFTVSDILLRRISLGLSEGLGEDAISYVAEQIKNYFNLSQEEITKQVNDYYEKVIKLRKV
ncbi:MAG: hypothetical protein A3I68_08160 [Candidatus Melainabacteria bacterium RIFCSPLOWO2_02_FULL_35_15]|nr:MAG: hypothetical protein A3F80_08385 [Candidatus Melainabacteria bacterium RIFCSPLOWO2_12_FULL_35_11]OGI13952.1 MAG: hypothetical protein A3I68_08160 [Candidatus Melainabacteria bacterium RIFCSPLOWO2_02_FULL_35_15]